MSEKFTAWITRYALTKGIQKVQAESCFDISENMIVVREGYAPQYYHGNEWHRTRDDAVLRAEEMRKAKLKSIDKNRDRLLSIKF